LSSYNEFIQSCSTSYELLYHSVDIGNKKKILNFSDTEWATWTCVLQGIWKEWFSGDDINSYDLDKTKKMIFTADDFGKVKLFRFPFPV